MVMSIATYQKRSCEFLHGCAFFRPIPEEVLNEDFFRRPALFIDLAVRDCCPDYVVAVTIKGPRGKGRIPANTIHNMLAINLAKEFMREFPHIFGPRSNKSNDRAPSKAQVDWKSPCFQWAKRAIKIITT